ncbi:MAG: class I SAM-dependent methyltransferase [Bauldia sp.]
MRALAAQLRRPSGEAGLTTAREMNEVNRPLTEAAIGALAPAPGETIAEIGPGNGKLSEPILEAIGRGGRYFGIDHSEAMAKAAQATLSRYGNARIFAGDYRAAPLAPASVDAVLAVNVIYFIDDLALFLSTIRGWLRLGGRIVLGTRSKETLRVLPMTQHGFIVRDVFEIEAALRAARLADISRTIVPEGNVEIDGRSFRLQSLVIKATARG